LRPADALRPRIRKAPCRPVSRFQRLLAAGEAVVEPEGNLCPAYLGIKRAMDVLGAMVLLALLAPVMLATYVVLWITTGGRPIFRQVRLGWCGRPFVIYKFRTMVLDADKRQHEVPNEQSSPIFKNRRDPRVTWFGRVLRRTSLDETPQLFNVLAGQMSLVGPRPPLAKEVAEYEPWQRRRLAVKPGLTCLWQVSGRSEIGFEDWVRMDLQYVRHQDFGSDLKLLLRTPWSVLRGRGAY
jgi:lipopolysaccharide/colanic/teichoic acid biosynthesis glycosyltransferase